jgi:hypothetical protein
MVALFMVEVLEHQSHAMELSLLSAIGCGGVAD